MKFSFHHTRFATYLGYINQAVVNNLAPLLFVTFRNQFGVSLTDLALLVTVNFVVQIFIDLLSITFIDRIGYRYTVILSQILCMVGLLCMGILPFVLSNGFVALLISIVFSAVGGGLSEVVISPLLESLPSNNKSASMSLLHSFYSWGQVLVVLLSTLYFVLIGIESWRWLAILWSILPLFNTVMFAVVPMCKLVESHERMPIKGLLSSIVFWIMLLLMLAAGAAEQAMAQWASLFAETGLGVSKTLGDLLGPCAFAVLMGVSRMYYGIKGGRINLKNALAASAGLCILSYAVAALSENPVIALLGCGFCGFSVGLMWPGVYSLCSLQYPKGGTAMFALLAFGGDMGCSVGPALVARISDLSENSSTLLSRFFSGTPEEIALKAGLGSAVVFPVIMLLGILFLKTRREKAAV